MYSSHCFFQFLFLNRPQWCPPPRCPRLQVSSLRPTCSATLSKAYSLCPVLRSGAIPVPDIASHKLNQNQVSPQTIQNPVISQNHQSKLILPSLSKCSNHPRGTIHEVLQERGVKDVDTLFSNSYLGLQENYLLPLKQTLTFTC